MITIDKMPLSTVQNEGFKLLMKTVPPFYTVPNRKTVSRLIDIRYEVFKKRFVVILKEVDSYSITCNNQTDVSNQSYLGVTIYYVTKQIEMKSGCIGIFPMSENHISQYLGKCLNSVIELKFGLIENYGSRYGCDHKNIKKLYTTLCNRTIIRPVLRILYLILQQMYLSLCPLCGIRLQQ